MYDDFSYSLINYLLTKKLPMPKIFESSNLIGIIFMETIIFETKICSEKQCILSMKNEKYITLVTHEISKPFSRFQVVSPLDWTEINQTRLIKSFTQTLDVNY